jgi:hypothetical protein
MRKLILVVALIILAACETSNSPTVPTMLESNASASASVSATSSVQAQQTALFYCPVVTPFSATIGVAVVAGNVSLVVNSITAQFTDVNHTQLPTITLPAPIPISQFGSNLVAARSGVTIPVTVNFGCGTARTGTVTMAVNLSDGNGVSFVRNLSVNVR